ncbi:MAG: AzlC family transporter permease [Ilumatobacteraceae bacterium]|nr:AzlC family transporter permease [Ilumatobacteraceae bacterium]
MFQLLRDPRTRTVVTASITLGVAVGVFGISFGVGAVSAHATVLQACAISLLVFTGASQFSAISVLLAGGSYSSALGGALVLGARNGVYGLAMSTHLTGRLGTRVLAAQLTIDESTSMALAQDDEQHRRVAFWITGCSVFVFWNLGTLVGALAGRAIDPQTFGLDAAFPAAYVAMVWPLLRGRRPLMAAAIGAVVCVALIPFAPIGVPILCAALAVLVGVPAPAPIETRAAEVSR